MYVAVQHPLLSGAQLCRKPPRRSSPSSTSRTGLGPPCTTDGGQLPATATARLRAERVTCVTQHEGKSHHLAALRTQPLPEQPKTAGDRRRPAEADGSRNSGAAFERAVTPSMDVLVVAHLPAGVRRRARHGVRARRGGEEEQRAHQHQRAPREPGSRRRVRGRRDPRDGAARCTGALGPDGVRCRHRLRSTCVRPLTTRTSKSVWTCTREGWPGTCGGTTATVASTSHGLRAAVPGRYERLRSHRREPGEWDKHRQHLIQAGALRHVFQACASIDVFLEGRHYDWVVNYCTHWRSWP